MFVSGSSCADPLSAIDSLPESSDSDDSVSPSVSLVRARDRDFSRGMGNHLRWPHSVRSPGLSGTKRSHPNDPYSGRSSVVPVATPVNDGAISRIPPVHEPNSRALRPRRQPPSNLMPYSPPLLLAFPSLNVGSMNLFQHPHSPLIQSLFLWRCLNLLFLLVFRTSLSVFQNWGVLRIAMW